MRKKLLALLALVAALSISPNLHADTFPFSFVGPGGVSASGTLDATDVGSGKWVVDSGTGTFNDGLASGSISLIANPNAPDNSTLSPSGYFAYDDLIFPTAARGQILTPDGLLFSFGALELNFWQTGGPRGTDGWGENTGAGGYGTFALSATQTVVPEPGTLLLAATGLLGLAAIRFATAK